MSDNRIVTWLTYKMQQT